MDTLTAPPNSENQIHNEMRFKRRPTYSMEASILISGDVLNAADHTRGMGEIRDIVLCSLGRMEAVGGLMISRSVVLTRRSMRSPNCEFTANEGTRQEPSHKREQVTLNDLCWYILGTSTKQGPARLLKSCICFDSCTFMILRISTFN